MIGISIWPSQEVHWRQVDWSEVLNWANLVGRRIETRVLNGHWHSGIVTEVSTDSGHPVFTCRQTRLRERRGLPWIDCQPKDREIPAQGIRPCLTCDERIVFALSRELTDVVIFPRPS